MTRSCPKCNQKLGFYDSYFCSVCGETLPDSLVNPPPSFSRLVSVEKNIEKSQVTKKALFGAILRVFHILNYKKLAEVLLLCGLILVALYWVTTNPVISGFIGWSPMSKKDTGVKAPGVDSTTKNSVKISSTFAQGSFGQHNLLEFVPFDADIFFECTDFDKFASVFVGYDTGYKKPFDDIKGLVRQNFIVFGKKVSGVWEFGLILTPKDPVKVLSLDTKDYQWLKAKVVEDTLLVSTSSSIVDDMESAKKKLTKNIKMNPFYINGAKGLLSKGSFEVFLMTGDGKFFASNYKKLNLPSDYSKIIEAFNNSKIEYGVIY